MITYQREKSHDLWEESMPLFERHWEEIAVFKDIPLSPSKDAYNTLEDVGMLRCYTARDDGRLIGYAVFVITKHLHYSQNVFAMQDVVFVLPESRMGRTGLKLLDFSEEQLKTDKVTLVQHHMKNAHPALGVLLKHKGYSPSETLWTKRLDGG